MKSFNTHEIDGIPVAMNSVMDSICSIQVSEFLYQEECGNSEHEIIMMEQYNSATEEFRVKMFIAGWWWGIDLPYEALPDGGLIVKWQLDLDEETTFETPWDAPKNGYNQSPSKRESFCPPVPLTAQPSWHNSRLTRQSDGFERDCYLIYPWEL
jgi:hypothetical protein